MLSKTLFSECDISACLPLPSIFGPIMETCVYLSLLPRIPNLPASCIFRLHGFYLIMNYIFLFYFSTLFSMFSIAGFLFLLSFVRRRCKNGFSKFFNKITNIPSQSFFLRHLFLLIVVFCSNGGFLSFLVHFTSSLCLSFSLRVSWQTGAPSLPCRALRQTVSPS